MNKSECSYSAYDTQEFYRRNHHMSNMTLRTQLATIKRYAASCKTIPQLKVVHRMACLLWHMGPVDVCHELNDIKEELRKRISDLHKADHGGEYGN